MNPNSDVTHPHKDALDDMQVLVCIDENRFLQRFMTSHHFDHDQRLHAKYQDMDHDGDFISALEISDLNPGVYKLTLHEFTDKERIEITRNGRVLRNFTAVNIEKMWSI